MEQTQGCPEEKLFFLSADLSKDGGSILSFFGLLHSAGLCADIATLAIVDEYYTANGTTQVAIIF